MPTVVIAPDSFKGTLPALEVARAIALGWAAVRPDDELVLLPQADGGEGTLDAVEASVPGAVRRSAGMVAGPDRRPVPGEWLLLPDGTGVVELAQCSGLPLMAAPDPLGATTRGLGEVVRAALAAGVDELVIGLGGSASTDGALGALIELGLEPLDANGRPALRLADIAELDGELPVMPLRGVTLLTDVTSPLLGPEGAAAVFGPQKGATPEQVVALEAGLARWTQLLGGDPSAPGSGAAGGAGYGFATAWGARIVSGADRVAELSGLPAAVEEAAVVVTGEGRFDSQSAAGKVVGRVLALGHPRTGVIAGQVAADPGVWHASLAELAGSTSAAMAEPARWLRGAGALAAHQL